MLIIEIDGASHIGKEEYADEKDIFLRGLDMRVLHISDEWVKKISKAFSNILKKK